MKDLKEQFHSVYKKLQVCFDLLANIISHSLKYEYEARFDYDAINNDAFLENLLQLIEDNIHIVYVDITNVSQQMQITMGKAQLSPLRLAELRKDHAILHDCKVEGSYFIIGDSGSWLVFYDAQLDLGYCLSDDAKVMARLYEYVIN